MSSVTEHTKKSQNVFTNIDTLTAWYYKPLIKTVSISITRSPQQTVLSLKLINISSPKLWNCKLNQF